MLMQTMHPHGFHRRAQYLRFDGGLGQIKPKMPASEIALTLGVPVLALAATGAIIWWLSGKAQFM
jgi:1-acyl-sn-glycerol-3-phosphate acyltransferase